MIASELTVYNQIALVRFEAGKPFGGDRLAKDELQELGLMEQKDWTIPEAGHQVVGELVGIPYKGTSGSSDRES